nr:PD40 domain-containing protein [Bacteroidota bacterium]
DDTWSDPQLMDTVVNSNHHEYFPSVAENGTMYFTRGSETGEFFIYRSRFVDGKYTKAEKLPKQVNSGKNRFNAFVARDESYLILSVYGLSETFGGMDYYIVFRNEDDTWEDPINLGNKINTNGSEEYSPYVSPDGRYFFFMSKRSIPDDSIPEKLSYEFLQKMHNHCNNGHSDIYWVAAQIIEDLKPKELK